MGEWGAHVCFLVCPCCLGGHELPIPQAWHMEQFMVSLFCCSAATFHLLLLKEMKPEGPEER